MRRRRRNEPLRGGPEYWQELQHLALSTGLQAVGVAPVSEMLHTREQLRHRIEQKLVNGMQFTFRNPERSTTPSNIVHGAQSMIVAALSYAALESDDTIDAVDYPARVARYAWADYQQVLKDKLTVISNQLRHDGHAAVVFADDNALVDREAAKRAGLGWYGKNANILVEGSGSFCTWKCRHHCESAICNRINCKLRNLCSLSSCMSYRGDRRTGSGRRQ